MSCRAGEIRKGRWVGGSPRGEHRMLPPWSLGEGSSEQGLGGESRLGLRVDKIAAADRYHCKKEVWEGEARLSLLWDVG